MKRKLILAAAMFALMAAAVFGQMPPDTPERAFKAKASEDGKSCSIIGYNSSLPKNVIIPSRISNLPVTSIEDNAFQGCTTLESIYIGTTIKSIGSKAFQGCNRLQSVHLFSKIISQNNFSADAFDGLGDLRDVFYATDKNYGTAGSYTRGAKTNWKLDPKAKIK